MQRLVGNEKGEKGMKATEKYVKVEKGVKAGEKGTNAGEKVQKVKSMQNLVRR